MINSGRFINDSMGGYVAKQIVKQLVKAGKQIQNSKVLIMGITFKEDVSDIRNSKVVDVYRELLSYGVNVDVVDPYANAEEVKEFDCLLGIPEEVEETIKLFQKNG